MPVDLRPRNESSGPMCVHHGGACAMGAQELPELYRMAIEAKRAAGQDVPPLDEHRLMTGKERKQYLREAGELATSLRARNDQIEAQLRDERDRISNEQESE